MKKTLLTILGLSLVGCSTPRFDRVLDSYSEASKITYVSDSEFIDGGDYWQLPTTTKRIGGDCEDKSFYLQSLLDSYSIGNRVVFGIAQLGQGFHAWNEVKINNKVYILDATQGVMANRTNLSDTSYMEIKSPYFERKMKEYQKRLKNNEI